MCKSIKLLVFVFFTYLLLGCSQNPFVGVGNAVDTERPKISVTSHLNGDFVGLGFTISGKCTDNVLVKSVNILIKGSSTSYPAVISEDNWSIDFISEQIGFGDKTFEITAVDKSGNYESTRLFLFIDVELPTVHINEPQLLTEDSIKSFSSIFPDRNDFLNIDYFINNNFIIKGYIDDNFTLQFTKLQIFNDIDPLPVKEVQIDKDIIPDTTIADGNPLMWTFKINSRELTETEGKFKIKMVTQDMAGNENISKTQTLGWIYVDQGMDIPRVVFNSVKEGDKISPESVISGNSFDDDGISKIYIKIIREGLKPGPYTGWLVADTTSDIQPDSVVVVIDKSVDKPRLYTWSCHAPVSPGSYMIYVQSIDSFGIGKAESDGLSFMVADQNDPVVIVTSHIDNQFLGEDVTFAGYCTDNVLPVKLILKAESSKISFLKELDITSSLIEPVYNEEKKIYIRNFSYTTKIAELAGYTDKTVTWIVYDNENNYTMMRMFFTGDNTAPDIAVTSHANGSFMGAGANLVLSGTARDNTNVRSVTVRWVEGDKSWTSDNGDVILTGSVTEKNWNILLPVSEIGGYTNKKFEISATDNEGNPPSITTVTLIGDSDSPLIEILTPIVDEFVGSTFAFSGKVYDNVNVAKVTITLNNASISPSSWDLTPGSGLSAENTLVSATNRYMRSFERAFTIEEVGGYTEKEFTLTVTDSEGNSTKESRRVTGDRNIPVVNVISHTNGDYVKDAVTLTGTASDLRKDGVTGVITKVEVKCNETGLVKNAVLSGASWSAEFTGLSEGEKNFEITAYDDQSNKGYDRIFIVSDTTAPDGLSIAIPTLKSTLAGLAGLSESNINDLQFLQNQTISLKGSANDNYKLKSLHLRLLKDGTSEVYTNSITMIAGIPVFEKPADTLAGSTPSNYTFTIDTTTLSDNSNYLVALESFDFAGNSVITDTGYFRVQQSADTPKTDMSSVTNQAFPGYTAAGMCFDDDGVSRIYYYVGTATTPADYTAWSGYDTIANSPMIAPWQKKVPLTGSATGNYYFAILPIDKNGKPGTKTEKTINVSTSDNPYLAIGAITGDNVSGTYKDAVTIALDASGGGTKKVTIIKYRINTSIKDSGWVTYDPVDDETVSYSVGFNTADYSDANVRYINFEAYCINDKAPTPEESMRMTRTIVVDNDKPVVTITSPVSGITINGTERLSGSCSDAGSLVKSMYIGYFDETTTPDVSTEVAIDGNSMSTAIINKWLKMTPKTSWSHDFNSTIITGTSVSNYKLLVAAVDTLGNIGVAQQIININQDLDRPLGNVTNPGYTGSTVIPDISAMTMVSTGFLMTGTAEDDDGVKAVEVKIEQWNGTVWTTKLNWTTVTGTLNWTFKVTGLIAHDTNYYRVIPRITDYQVNAAYPTGRIEDGTPSYFIVASKQPIIEILSPSNEDPDKDIDSLTGFVLYDQFGSIVSNVKDDLYWDNISTNLDMYYIDSPRNKFGWNTLLKENTFSIFENGDADNNRSDYYRMIFKAKDSDAGHITLVEISYDGGSSWDAAYTDGNGSTFTVTDISKYAYKTNHENGYTWFFVNIETQYLPANSIIKIRATDNNSSPAPYETVATVMMNIDNTTPDVSVVAWGTNDPDVVNDDLSKTKPYIGGNASDNGSGIRYVNLYFWNNRNGPDDNPSYNAAGIGTLTASVISGTHKVTIPDDLGSSLTDTSAVFGSPFPVPDGDDTPDYWTKAYMYTPSNWKVDDIYDWNYDKNSEKYYGLKTKYTVNPTDGKKLLCVEAIDNAGNKSYTFKEVMFAEFPPVINIAQTLIKWKAKENTADSATENSSSLTAPDTRLSIGNKLTMSGRNADSKAGDSAPGINRVLVVLYSDDGDSDLTDETIQATWSVTGGTGTGTGNYDWTLGEKSLIGFAGNYYLIVETRDITGVITTAYQKLFIDNAIPVVAVTKPAAAKKVAGDFRVYGTANDGSGSGLEGTTPVTVEVLNGASVVKTDTIGVTAGNWENWWLNTASYTFDSVRVTAIDKAKNKSVTTVSVVKDTQPPVYNSFSATGGVTIAQGSGLNYATFTGLYPKVSSAGEIFLMRNNGSNQIAFATDIYDTDGFSDADLYISGSKQSDGGVIAETTQSYSTSVHANTVGGTNTFTSLTDGEYEYRSLVKQDADAIEINLKKYFIVDNQRPHVWLEKLKDTDFVTATVAKGHVDTGLTANGTADDVSGVVKFYVNAFDNYLLKEIRVQCTTLSGISTWKTLATRSAAGVWTFSDYNGGTANNIDDTGYWAAFEESKSLASDADKLRLRLEINTAQVTNVARLANTLEFSAIDWAGNEVDLATYSDEQATTPVFSAASPNSGYQKSVRKMLDVVPYITEITTSLTAAFAKDFARSASGKYPVLIDTINATYEQVTVNGFNLNPVISGGASGDVRISKDIDAYNAGKVGTGLAFNTLAANKTSFKTIVQTAGSGYLSVFTNGIPSINNINAERVSNSENSSAHLTVYDDRYLSVWNINKLRQTVALANNAVYPSMKMNSNNPAFAYANNAGGWGIALYYDGTTEKKVYENWDLFTYTSIGFNSSGNHGILYDINVVNGNNGDNNSGDKGGLLTSFYYDVPGTGWNSWSYRFNDNQLWLDNLSHPTVTSVLDRYQHPDMYMNGTTDTTKVFVSFYDKLENRIIFRTFNVGTNAVIDDVTGGRINNAGTALYTNLAQYEEDGTFPEYDDTDLRFAANNNSGKTPPGQQIIESTYTGNFSAVASTTDGNTAMIVYYDASGTGGLRFKYNTTPVNSGTWVSHKNSSGTDTVLDSGYGGEFVDMAVDSQNHIHIAYYDNNNGDLRYIYMPAYDSNSSQVEKYLVDSYFDVGDKITVTVNTSDVPYIAYKGINRSGKIAWLNGSRGHGTDSSGKFTGTWECQTLPTIINDSDSNRFNIGIGTDGMPVSGYTNGGIEYIRLLPELSN